MIRWLVLSCLLLLAWPVQAARITGIVASTGVVTISTDGPAAVAFAFALDDPFRLVIDIPAVVAAPLTAPGAGSIAGVRLAMYAPGVARLVVDLAAPLEIVTARAGPDALRIELRRVPAARFSEAVKRGRRPLPVLTVAAPASVTAATSFDLPAAFLARGAGNAGKPAEKPPEPSMEMAIDKPATKARPRPADNMPPADVTEPPTGADSSADPPRPKRQAVKSRSGGRPLVVIDAGHGGKDVGAISIDGGHEKDVTLAIARAAARLLEKQGRVRVQLTRGDDRFIPLGGRVQIARNARADLFVSIHADSAPNPDARGASVYTLSAVASDAVAARLAARENKADIIGGVNLGAEAPEVSDILIDLSRRATGNVSVAFAETLQDVLASRIGFRGEFHHFAGFYVLKAPDVPSVLLETGYVSNAEDSALLFSDAGRQRIAEGIAAAIERHLAGD
jgi:N-acetylmuramoyl-L-alanine amidase